MNKELIETLKYLRLGGLLAHWDDYLKLAAEGRFSHARLLAHVLEEECGIKRQNARQLRLKRARIPDPLVNMNQSQNLLWLGATGCGKTGLATSFLIHAIAQSYSGRYVLFADLIAELYRSMADHSQDEVLKEYLAFDCLQVDEIGCVEVEPAQAGLFLTLIQGHPDKLLFPGSGALARNSANFRFFGLSGGMG